MGFKESNTEGKVGEKMYADYLKENNINFIDVSDDDYCQLLDIDFIIPQGNHTKEEILSHIRKGNPYKRKERQQQIGYTVEVKLDKVTHNRFKKTNGEISNGTGNLVYELISHNMSGCLARSYADFVLYVCVDTFDEYAILKKAYMINLYKWRESMTDSGKENKQSLQLKPLKYIKEGDEFIEENVLNILHPVIKLKEYKGALIDFTQKLENFFPKNLVL